MSRERIAIVGPVYPYKGGIAQHTTALANYLHRQGSQVEVFSWLRQYPRLLYPGRLTVDAPELELQVPAHRTLSWWSPWSWRRTATDLARFDIVVIAHVTPVQAPAYITLLRRLRRSGVRTVLLCHNVQPHEPSPLDTRILRSLLAMPTGVLVHSRDEAERAAALTDRPIATVALPPFLPVHSGRPQRVADHEYRRLLFFGMVRPYKGLDLLLRALAEVGDDIRLRVAGEFWGGTQETTALVTELGLGTRVELRDGYVDATDVPALFEDVDALVLPYRSATGSQNVWIAFEHGVPVIATDVGALARDVRPGVDGIVAAPSVESLAHAIAEFYRPGVRSTLHRNVAPVSPEPYWVEYSAVLMDAAGWSSD